MAETRAMRDETLTFTIQPNSAITQHFATVTLNSNNGAILQSIIFCQAGGTAEGMVEIHEETVGTLQQLLASYDKATIKAMKVTDVMNDKDFLQIYHEMPTLRDLDISEVNIISLPNRSFYQSENVENLILPKSLITIPNEVFYQSAVKNIIFYDKLASLLVHLHLQAAKGWQTSAFLRVLRPKVRRHFQVVQHCLSLRLQTNAHWQH